MANHPTDQDVRVLELEEQASDIGAGELEASALASSLAEALSRTRTDEFVSFVPASKGTLTVHWWPESSIPRKAAKRHRPSGSPMFT
jgi:hypothetical protein